MPNAPPQSGAFVFSRVRHAHESLCIDREQQRRAHGARYVRYTDATPTRLSPAACATRTTFSTPRDATRAHGARYMGLASTRYTIATSSSTGSSLNQRSARADGNALPFATPLSQRPATP